MFSIEHGVPGGILKLLRFSIPIQSLCRISEIANMMTRTIHDEQKDIGHNVNI